MFTHLTHVDPDENMNRWYTVMVQPTLLDPVAVITAWGSRENDF
jgi:predicted DNA-binding WGR domain protein